MLTDLGLLSWILSLVTGIKVEKYFLKFYSLSNNNITSCALLFIQQISLLSHSNSFFKVLIYEEIIITVFLCVFGLYGNGVVNFG